MPARPSQEERDLLDAIRVWRLADEDYNAARKRLDEARKQLVTELKAAGVEGFSL